MLLDMIIWGESPITLRRITICTCQVDLYFQVIFHKSDYCITIYVSGVPSEISDCKHPVRVRRCKSFHCKSCHSLHAPSLPPNSPSNINPLRFYLPPTFILTETLSRSLVISLKEEKKQPVWLIALSQLLFVSSQFHFSPPGSLSLYVFRSLRVFAWGNERERVQPHFWHIGSFPLGLRLAAHQHQQVTQEQGRNRKWAACGGDSSLEGLSGSTPSAFIAKPSPCQSSEQGT